jgi:hypothetical protein
MDLLRGRSTVEQLSILNTLSESAPDVDAGVRRAVEALDRFYDPCDREVEHRVVLIVNERQARLLMVGQVPPEVREMAKCAVDWEFELSQLGRSGDERGEGETREGARQRDQAGH